MERIPNFWALNQMIGLFPELNFRQFAIEPTVTDNAVFARSFSGEISGLRRASDGRKCRNNFCHRPAFQKFPDTRRVLADEGISKANNVDDRGAFHTFFVAADVRRLKSFNEPRYLGCYICLPNARTIFCSRC